MSRKQCGRWIKAGLKFHKEDKMPLLIIGQDLTNFMLQAFTYLTTITGKFPL